MTATPTKAQIAEALEGSIRKHKRIVRSTMGEDHGIKDCPLCKLFYPTCHGCPVMAKTGKRACQMTPYDDWVLHQGDAHDNDTIPLSRVPHCKECLRLERAEVAFLEGLRT